MKKVVLITNLIFIYVFSAIDISIAEKQDSVSLGKVQVTAQTSKGKLKTGDVKHDESSSFYTIITSEEFEGKLNTISEVIEKESGIQVRQTGGIASYSTVTLRGATSKQVLVYLDGVLLNDSSGGDIDINSISLSDVESIEIFKGTVPVNFIKSSIGGVINIKTKQAEKGLNGFVNVSYGSFETYKTNIFLNHKPGRFDYILNASYLKSENNYKIYNNNGTEFNTSDDRWEKRNNNQVEQKNILTRAGYDYNDDVRFEIFNQYNLKNENLPHNSNLESAKSNLEILRNLSYLRLIINNITSLNINTSIKTKYHYTKEVFDDRNNDYGFGENYLKNKTNSYGYNQFIELPTQYNILSLNINMNYEKYNPEDLLDRSDPRNANRKSINIALADTIILYNEKLLINPCVRYNYYKDEIGSGQEDITLYKSIDKSDKYWSSQIGLKYLLTSSFLIKTNLANAYREPTLNELYGDHGHFYGDDELKKENSKNFDIGSELNLKLDNNFLNKVFINFVYFQSNMKNMIIYTYDSRGIGSAENISESKIKGVESNLKFSFFKLIQLSASYTWQEALNESEIESYNNKKIPGQFEHSVFAKLEFLYENIIVFCEYVFESGMYYDTSNLHKAKEKKIVNTGFSYVYEKFKFKFEINNVFDYYYYDYQYSPRPGRSYYGTVQYNF